MLPPRVASYLLSSLTGAPDLMIHLLNGLSTEESDFRPEPHRFTIREVLAHLAEWENVFRGRIELTRDADRPLLQGYDEGQWAIDHDYASANWNEQLRLYGERRRTMVAILHDLTPEQWERAGNHTELGQVTIETQAVMVAAHDAYHLQQVAKWREGYG